MGFGDIMGTSTYLTYVKLHDRKTLSMGPGAPGFSKVYIGAGEQKFLDWQDCREYLTKTVLCQTHGMTGTLIIRTGFQGTGVGMGSGTYYQGRVGQGSYLLSTFTEQVGFVRYGFRASAIGSLTMAARFQT